MTLIEVINASLDELRDHDDDSLPFEHDGQLSPEETAVNIHLALNSPAVLAALEALPPAAQAALKDAWEVCSAF